MAAEAAVLAAGVKAVGSILGGIGGFQAGRARAKALRYAARNALREAGINASIQLEDSDRIGARAATLAAASGGGGLQGSALAVIDDLARQGMYRARQTVRDGIAQSYALKDEARVARAQADLDLVSGFIGGGSTFLGSLGTQAQKRRSKG